MMAVEVLAEIENLLHRKLGHGDDFVCKESEGRVRRGHV